MTELITAISAWIIPALLIIIIIFGLLKKVPVFESFVDGAKDGFTTAIQIIPFIVGMMVAISVFRESGALDIITNAMQPVFDYVGFPAEVFPLAFLRSISGTGALAITSDIIANYGPDSFIGRLASTMQGSTDTTLYIITVYFGAVGIKKVGYSIKVGLLADLVGIVASFIIVSIIF